MSNVVSLDNDDVGDGYVIPIEGMLEAAKHEDLRDVLIIGQQEDGSFYIAGSHGRPESMMLLQFAMHTFCSEALD